MAPARNPKKRTRASRRAPTTVLTTDTSNFRAMVQEFTGIPAPPFSAGGSSYSRRLDLSMGGFFPLRSSQPNPLFSASNTLLQNNMVDAIASTTNIAANSGSVVNYQLPPNYNHHLGLPNYPHGLTTFQPPLPVPSLIMMNSETRNDQGIIPLRHDHVYKDIESYGGDPSQPRVATGGSSFCKLSFPASSSSMEINNVSCTSSTSRPHPGVDTWICPSE
ncbi:VQ motif-containing protein [Quillaja saponaria]|nr:VQ motif-containing protein [Quillaja saponaria]